MSNKKSIVFRDEEISLLQTVTNCINSEFLDSRLLAVLSEGRRKVGGLVAVKDEDFVELITFHNERHFPFAYFDGNKVHRRLSRLQDNQKIVFDSFPFRLN